MGQSVQQNESGGSLREYCPIHTVLSTHFKLLNPRPHIGVTLPCLKSFLIKAEKYPFAKHFDSRKPVQFIATVRPHEFGLGILTLTSWPVAIKTAKGSHLP